MYPPGPKRVQQEPKEEHDADRLRKRRRPNPLKELGPVAISELRLRTVIVACI